MGARTLLGGERTREGAGILSRDFKGALRGGFAARTGLIPFRCERKGSWSRSVPCSLLVQTTLTASLPQLLDEVETEEDLDADGESDSPTKAKRTNRKTLPASYEPDKRADSWLKVKKDYLDDLGDSLDLVPLGAWHGSGRKSKWWSPILLGESGRTASGRRS